MWSASIVPLLNVGTIVLSLKRVDPGILNYMQTNCSEFGVSSGDGTVTGCSEIKVRSDAATSHYMINSTVWKMNFVMRKRGINVK